MASLDPQVHVVNKGATSRIVEVFILTTAGVPLTGLVFNTASLVAYYHRNSAVAGGTAIALVTMTVGTWTSLGFKEIDATNMPGWYQLGIPDAALATGADTVSVHLKGAATMADTGLAIDLIEPPATAAGLTSAVAPLATSAGLTSAVSSIETALALLPTPTPAPGSGGGVGWRDTK